MYRRGFIIALFDHDKGTMDSKLQNLIRVLHCMMNDNSYVRIRVKSMNFQNQCVDFSISVKKCWSKKWHLNVHVHKPRNAQFNPEYLSRKKMSHDIYSQYG